MNGYLEIYEIKSGLKGILFNSGMKGWKRKENIISFAHFKKKGGDATVYRVKGVFWFCGALRFLVRAIQYK